MHLVTGLLSQQKSKQLRFQSQHHQQTAGLLQQIDKQEGSIWIKASQFGPAIQIDLSETVMRQQEKEKKKCFQNKINLRYFKDLLMKRRHSRLKNIHMCEELPLIIHHMVLLVHFTKGIIYC